MSRTGAQYRKAYRAALSAEERDVMDRMLLPVHTLYTARGARTVQGQHPVCSNCGQYRSGTGRDCFNQCAARGFAPALPAPWPKP